MAATETETSLLRGFLAGAVWTAAWVQGRRLRDSVRCPSCGALHKDKASIRWDCLECELDGLGGPDVHCASV